MLDSMCQRYNMLPSKMLAEATTLDVFVFDMAFSWQNAQEQKARTKQKYTTDPRVPKQEVDSQALMQKYEAFQNKVGRRNSE